MKRKRAVQLTEVPQHIKPVNGITRKEIQEAKGSEKRTRMDDNQLTSRLLELFEKHQVFSSSRSVSNSVFSTTRSRICAILRSSPLPS